MDLFIILSFFDSTVETLEKFMSTPIDFFQEHYRNPLMWLAFLFGGLIVFQATYRALDKNQ